MKLSQFIFPLLFSLAPMGVREQGQPNSSRKIGIDDTVIPIKLAPVSTVVRAEAVVASGCFVGAGSPAVV